MSDRRSRSSSRISQSSSVAPKIFFRAALTCPHCGAVNEAKEIDLSSPLGNDPEWAVVQIGEVLDVSVNDLEETYLVLRHPETDRILIIEFFVCASCRRYAPVMLEMRVRTTYALQWVGATSIPALPKAVLDEAHYLTRKIEDWGPKPGEDTERLEGLKRQL